MTGDDRQPAASWRPSAPRDHRVDALSVDVGHDLWQRVEARLLRSPVEAVPPVGDEVRQPRHRQAAQLSGPRRVGRDHGARKPALEIGQRRAGEGDEEPLDGDAHAHDDRSVPPLRGVFGVTGRRPPRSTSQIATTQSGGTPTRPTSCNPGLDSTWAASGGHPELAMGVGQHARPDTPRTQSQPHVDDVQRDGRHEGARRGRCNIASTRRPSGSTPRHGPAVGARARILGPAPRVG